MKKQDEYYSPFIAKGRLGKAYQRIYIFLCRFFFRRIKIDEESLLHLRGLEEDAKIVYASMQSSQTSLYVQLATLEKAGYPMPMFSMGFRPWIVHRIIGLVAGIVLFYRKIFSSSSDRLVSDSEFIRNSLMKNRSLIFSMMSVPLFRRRYVENRSDAIGYLLDLQRETDSPVYIFPQVVFWNKNPERDGSLFAINPTGDNGIIRAAIGTIKSTTAGFLRVCAPLNLKEIMKANPGMERDELVHQIRKTLFDTYNHEKRVILGPHMKGRQQMMEMVLDHVNVKSVIENETLETGKDRQKLRKEAYRYYREIAADFSIQWIIFFRVISNWFFKKVFDGFHFSTEDFKKIRDWTKKGTLVFVPSHKSHLDYVIISNLLFHNNFIPPHIVAGANLSFFPLGTLFRKSGAFFMRRSFKGKNLYASVFKQYVKTLVQEGHSIEFFIEGGRSRTGKIISPKMGIVKYLIESVDEGYGKDLIIVPITVNYDRIMEETSYKKELRGREKTKESASSFLKSRKLIRKRYGKVYFAVNEPFSMKEYRDEFMAGHGKDCNGEFISALGSHIIRKINEIVMVTPFALVSAAILYTSKRGFPEDMVLERMFLLRNTVRSFGARIAPVLENDENMAAALSNVLDSYMDDGIIKKIEFEDSEDAERELYSLSDEERIRINFYKNSILYFTLPVNMLALAVISSAKKGRVSAKALRESFNEVKELFSREFDYPELLDESAGLYEKSIEFMKEQGIISSDSKGIKTGKEQWENLRFLAGTLRDYLESKLIVIKVIIKHKNRKFVKKDFVAKIRDEAVKMYHLDIIDCSEAISDSNFNNSIEKMVDMGLVEFEKRKDRDYVKTLAGERAELILERVQGYLDGLK